MDTTPARRAVAAASAALALALSLAAPVLAHAELVSSSPADGDVLATPPTTVTLTFSEDLDPAKSSFKLVTGAQTIGTGGVVSGGDVRMMTLDGLVLTPGAYTIRWTSAATDGHIERGTFSFSVAEPVATPLASATAAPPTASPTGQATPSASPASVQSPAATAPPAVSPDASGATGSGGDPASSTTGDVLIPIVAALVAVGGVGAFVLRRSRGV